MLVTQMKTFLYYLLHKTTIKITENRLKFHKYKKKQANDLYYLQFVYIVPLDFFGAKTLKFGKDDTVDLKPPPVLPATRPAEEVSG